MWGKNASPLKIRRFNSCFFEYQKGVDPLEINDFEGIKVYLSRDSRQTIAQTYVEYLPPQVYLSRDSRQNIARANQTWIIEIVYLSRDSRQTIARNHCATTPKRVYLSRDSRQTIAPDQRAV